MKTKIILILIPLFSVVLNVKSQSRIPDGQFTSPVNGNWTDSVKKYSELESYALWYVRKGHDSLFAVFNKKNSFYQHKIDSIAAINRELNTLALKHRLEAKYHIILP